VGYEDEEMGPVETDTEGMSFYLLHVRVMTFARLSHIIDMNATSYI